MRDLLCVRILTGSQMPVVAGDRCRRLLFIDVIDDQIAQLSLVAELLLRIEEDVRAAGRVKADRGHVTVAVIAVIVQRQSERIRVAEPARR